MEPYYQHAGITIYHGDCREILPTLPKCDLLLTDPPYGMALTSGWDGVMGNCSVIGDDDHALRDWVCDWWGNDPALIFGRWSIPKPLGIRMVLTWEKGNHVGMGDLSTPWKPNTEEIYVLGSGFEGHRGSSVLKHLAIAGCVGAANTGLRNHTTEKPVTLMEELLGKCPQEWVILDPFMGSGTTLVAARYRDRGEVLCNSRQAPQPRGIRL